MRMVPAECLRAVPLAALPAGEVVPRLLDEGGFSAREKEALHGGLSALLEKVTGRYLAGHSDSLPAEQAAELLESLLYQLGLALKQKGDAAARKALFPEGLPALQKEGEHIACGQVAGAKRLLRAARNNQVKTAHRYYLETLNAPLGAVAFFSLYDPYYGAGAVLECNDYPLCQMPGPFAGTEYLARYLEGMLAENRFLGRFAPEDIHRVMAASRPGYEQMPVGMFEPVLRVALGCVLSGTSPWALRPGAWKRGEGDPQLLFRAAQKLCEEMHLSRQDKLRALVLYGAKEMWPRLRAMGYAGR